MLSNILTVIKLTLISKIQTDRQTDKQTDIQQSTDELAFSMQYNRCPHNTRLHIQKLKILLTTR